MACIQAGGVLAVPTDSYYALAVGIYQPAALERLLSIKAHRNHKTFPVLVGEISQVNQLAQLGSDIDVILDGGPTFGGQPSTVLQVEPELRLFHQGEISLVAIQDISGNGILVGSCHAEIEAKAD